MKCKRCGRQGATVIDEGNFFCRECAELFGTCAMCVHSAKCEFNDNPAPIPQAIMQKTRQQTEMGYIEQIQQVPNPQRIKAMCMETECVCCKECDDKKIRCMRQFGTCEKYSEIKF